MGALWLLGATRPLCSHERWHRKQLGNLLRQQVPNAGVFAQTDMPAHRGYHKRKKPTASSKPI